MIVLVLRLLNEHSRVQKLATEKMGLEQTLHEIEQVNAELKSELQGSTEKLGALANLQQQTDQLKQALETKLSQIHSSLRRLIGFRQDAPGRRARAASPMRSRSPAGRRSVSPGRDATGTSLFKYYNLQITSAHTHNE